MGLAASQSRFLLLTARQNSLNSRMLSLQNQNMALQRQSAILSQDYNKKQNAQLVTYNEQPLNYAALMSPNTSGYNNMLTSSSGAVVLTNTMAGKLGLTALKGDGSDFLSKIDSPNKLMQALGVSTNISNNTSSRYTWDRSAYKYDDSIMNNAIVNVQSATVLALNGYLYDEKGNINSNAFLEYAMGTQQNSFNVSTQAGMTSSATDENRQSATSLACIYTLDKYQNNENNVHAVTNSFVESATSAMSQVMTNALGFTDAVGNALEYATEMTKKKYASSTIYAGMSETSDRMNAKVTASNNEYDAKIADIQAKIDSLPASIFYASDKEAYQAQIAQLTAEKAAMAAYLTEQYSSANIDNIRANAEQGMGASDLNGTTSSKYNSTGICVTGQPFHNTTTTGVEVVSNTVSTSGVEFEIGKTYNYTKKVDVYDGADVFVNTAQLTATFLNYFDIGMMKELGTKASTAFANYLEGRMSETDDIISLRNEIKDAGLSYYDSEDSTTLRNSFRLMDGYSDYPVNDNEVVKWTESKTNDTIRGTQRLERYICVSDDAGDFFINVEKTKPTADDLQKIEDAKAEALSSKNSAISSSYNLEGLFAASNKSGYISQLNTKKELVNNTINDENSTLEARKTVVQDMIDFLISVQVPESGGIFDVLKSSLESSLTSYKTLLKKLEAISDAEFSSQNYTLNFEKDLTAEPDKNGNYKYYITIDGLGLKYYQGDDASEALTSGVSNLMSSYYNTTVDFSYMVNKGFEGTAVIGQYGKQSLLSNTFDEAATGVFGAKNEAKNDYKNLVKGSSTSSVATSKEPATGEYAISYYKGLFNALAAGGWVIDGKVNDSSYLSQQLLQGNMVLQQFNNSKSWAALQLGDSKNGLDVTKDQDTIDKAKAEYESKTAIMKTKQTFLENEIESLKTQSEAIDKEKESIQTIMEKEQEKFKIFTSG